jgi:hypothetical protein
LELKTREHVKAREKYSSLIFFLFSENTPDASSLSAANTLTANSNQLLSESENPEYKTLLERLRTYHADVKRLLDRLNLDYPGEMKLKSSLINVVCRGLYLD